MKKLVLVLFVLCLSVPVMAEEVTALFKVGGMSFYVPIKDNVDMVFLYDIWQGQGLMGGQSKIIEYEAWKLNGGAVSSFLGQGTPFLSIDRIITKTGLHTGLWIGYDFELTDWRAGVKSSVKLW